MRHLYILSRSYCMTARKLAGIILFVHFTSTTRSRVIAVVQVETVVKAGFRC